MTTNEEVTSEAHQDSAPPEAWDRIGAGYAEFVAPGEEPIATAALRMVDLVEGQTFLDVAAGTGGLSLPAARLGARVMLTSDLNIGWGRKPMPA